MFTGLIEETGKITSCEKIGAGTRFDIEASKIFSDLKIDDSVAVNGCCLTVIRIKNSIFTVEAVEETLKKTTLGTWTTGTKVNLERAATLSSRLGGHLVLGHIDGVGSIQKIETLSSSHMLYVEIPKSLQRYVIKIGSITIDGISLTVADIMNNLITLAIIPHTWEKTNLSDRKAGDGVHVEADMIAKHLEKLMTKEIEPEMVTADFLLKDIDLEEKP